MNISDEVLNKLVKRIAEKTQDNDHNGSILELATFLNNKKSIKVMNHIIGLHEVYGHMPQELMALRRNEFKYLLGYVEINYGIEERNKINKAF